MCLTPELASLTGECGFLDLCEDWVVDARLAGDAVAQPVQRVLAFVAAIEFDLFSSLYRSGQIPQNRDL